jgi:hypothetical protein
MKKKAGTKMVSYFMIYNKEPLLPITVSFLLPPTAPQYNRSAKDF